MRVAYIGLGSMGADQAKRIAGSAHELTVFDVSAEARAKFQDIATVAGCIEDAVSGAEMVQVCVRDVDQVNDVLFGDGNLASSARPGRWSSCTALSMWPASMTSRASSRNLDSRLRMHQ